MYIQPLAYGGVYIRPFAFPERLDPLDECSEVSIIWRYPSSFYCSRSQWESQNRARQDGIVVIRLALCTEKRGSRIQYTT